MLTDDLLHYIDRSVLCWLATVDAAGAPNVSPKEVFCAHGSSTVLVANIASPQSDRNLRGNPQVCLSFVEVGDVQPHGAWGIGATGAMALGYQLY